MILAREEIVAALPGLMVELQAFDPVYLGAAEIAGEVFGASVRWSSSSTGSEARRPALRRYGVESFALPADPEIFGRMLQA